MKPTSTLIFMFVWIFGSYALASEQTICEADIEVTKIHEFITTQSRRLLVIADIKADENSFSCKGLGKRNTKGIFDEMRKKKTSIELNIEKKYYTKGALYHAEYIYPDDVWYITKRLDVKVVNPKAKSNTFTKGASSYHSIDTAKDCKVRETYEANMGGFLSCGQYADLQIALAEDDLRMNLYITRNKKVHDLKLWNLFSGFSLLGKIIEFRHPKDKPDKIYAMIFRDKVTEYTKDKHKDVSYLLVAKITPKHICLVGKIKPQKDQNILAREMADKAIWMPCLFEKDNI